MSWSKRVTDVIGAATGLILFAPLFLIIAAAIRIDDPGPVFFAHTRVGRNGHLFRMWKFRTMERDAERRGGPLTIASDPRETRLGRLLRQHKLDELPQLLNVLIGDMSLVGPRPESPKFVALYDGEQRTILGLVPGMTDPASIRYCDLPSLLAGTADPEEFYVTRIIRHKIQLQLAYARRATTLSDLWVVAQTLRCVMVAARKSGPPPEVSGQPQVAEADHWPPRAAISGAHSDRLPC